MSTLVLCIHIILCIGLILLVLLQHGKGADAGALMGSKVESFLGAGSAGSFISRLTTGMAIAFMVTSICLVYFSKSAMTLNAETGRQQYDILEGSVVEGIVPPTTVTEGNSDSTATAQENTETTTEDTKTEVEKTGSVETQAPEEPTAETTIGNN